MLINMQQMKRLTGTAHTHCPSPRCQAWCWAPGMLQRRGTSLVDQTDIQQLMPSNQFSIYFTILAAKKHHMSEDVPIEMHTLYFDHLKSTSV